MNLKPWYDVYPYGTKEGDEECRFFCAIARHPDFKYRSVEKLAEESRLSKSRVEEIITKYAPSGMVTQNPKEPDQWGYFERVGIKKSESDILDEEHNARLKKVFVKP